MRYLFGVLRQTIAMLAMVVALSLFAVEPAAAGSRSSMTVNGLTVTVVGGSAQNISAINDGARIELDGRAIVARPNEIAVDGTTYEVEDPYREIVIEAGEWGLKVSTDGTLIHEISEIEGLEAAAAKGNMVARNDLGVRYLTGRGVEKNPARALELYQAAAEQGLAVAQSNLAFLYWDGRHVAKDPRKAVFWAKKAAEGNNAPAMFIMALALESGSGVDRDDNAAVEWYRRAVEKGHVQAMNNLATRFLNGKSVEKDVDKAVALFVRSSDGGNALASNNLGVIYEQGLGVPVDLEKAETYFERAAAGNHQGASENLKRVRAALKVPSSGTASGTEAAAGTGAIRGGPPPLPESEKKIYWFAENGQKVGPMTLSELTAAGDSARVTGATLVWKAGLADWVPASSVPEIAERLK